MYLKFEKNSTPIELFLYWIAAVVVGSLFAIVVVGLSRNSQVQESGMGAEIKRATPAQMRKCFELVHQLKVAGIAFMPIPIIDDIEELYVELNRKLDIIEKNYQED